MAGHENAAKRKRNNWRGPFGEAAVYAVVFLHTIGSHRATVPNFASFFSFFWKQLSQKKTINSVLQVRRHSGLSA